MEDSVLRKTTYDTTRHLLAVIAHQDAMNERLTIALEQLTVALQDIKILVARNTSLSENRKDMQGDEKRLP